LVRYAGKQLAEDCDELTNVLEGHERQIQRFVWAQKNWDEKEIYLAIKKEEQSIEFG